MNVRELKGEAIRQFAIKLDSLTDEEELIMFLDFLNWIGGGNKNAISLSRHYEHIKLKYGPVLEKLAK